MINLSKISIEEFLCVPDITISTDNEGPDSTDFILSLKRVHLKSLSNNLDLYSLGDTDVGDRAIFEGDDLVGYYQGDVLFVKTTKRRSGLSKELILSAMLNRRELPKVRRVTTTGLLSLISAWKSAQP
jgi:hypothetical protein